MGTNSAIEWTTHTFNPWRGCSKVSAGCANCYAETLSKRNPATLGVWGYSGTRVIASDKYWGQPLKWNRAAKAAGRRDRVFCASLADWLEDRPELIATRARLMIQAGMTDGLTWLFLSKRPEGWKDRMREVCDYFRLQLQASYADDLEQWICGDFIPPRFWIGATVEDQNQKIRIDSLRHIPAAVRFLSCEPLLEDLGQLDLSGIHWVICGGESGAGARPMHPDWARNLRNQCKAAGIPFFFKQFGEWTEEMFSDEHDAIPDLRAFLFNDGTPVVRVGKKAAGRLLDGRTWDEFPNDTQMT